MVTQTKARTILELIKVTEKLFREKEISNPRLNAELLIASTLQTERINLYLDFEKPLTDTELTDFREKVKRRQKNEPLQYILGEAHFYGRKFNVNPSVLIPRPETELLVEKTLEVIGNKKASPREGGDENPKILEIGTGSGCISISIAANINCSIDAIDNDPEAINTATYNSRINSTESRINFFVSDFIKQDLHIDKYDIVISNPPYIPAVEFNTLSREINEYEPMNALTDNGNGLEFYRRIFTLYNSAAVKPLVIIEIGDGKKEAVENLANEFSIAGFTFYKDLLNIYRLISF
ncbi:MAG TPA: peptide chain release factor N(5)-glutamine methyltransferase [Ignavibacteria bacterium]|nr:peptide chain release factor N(5)-glutamine methyltransferase [Ignavibacteria bacterium]